MSLFKTLETRGLSARNRTIAATDTATSEDFTIRGNAAGGNITVNLPTAASAYNTALQYGQIYCIKKIDATVNTVTIDPNGAELIDGAATVVLTVQWEDRMIQSNGTSWDVL